MGRPIGAGLPAPAWWAAQELDAPAVISAQGERTRAELNGNAHRNRPEWVETYAACLRAGWRLTPVNWHLTAAKAAYIIEDCGVRALVLDATVRRGQGGTGPRAGRGQRRGWW